MSKEKVVIKKHHSLMLLLLFFALFAILPVRSSQAVGVVTSQQLYTNGGFAPLPGLQQPHV